MGFLKRRRSQREPVRTAHIEEDSYAFRRSRTLTGSLSDTVHTVGEQHAALKSDRVKQHDLRRHRRRLAALLIGCIFVVAGLYILLGQFIGAIAIASDALLTDERKQTYTSAIEAYLSSSPSERFSFSLHNDQLVATLQQDHPEVENVQLSRFGVTQPTIATITLRTPVISWELQGVTYYIDSHGVAFQTLTGTAPALRVEDNTGISLEDSSSLASEKMLQYIGRLIALVGQAGYTVERLELPAGTSRQINVYIQGQGYPFYTNSDRDPAGQVTDIVNALHYFTNRQVAPQYVDVRVGSRAYYQ